MCSPYLTDTPPGYCLEEKQTRKAFGCILHAFESHQPHAVFNYLSMLYVVWTARWPWTREDAFNAATFLNADDEIIGNAFGGFYNPGALGLDNVSRIFFKIYVLSSGRPVLIFQFI